MSDRHEDFAARLATLESQLQENNDSTSFGLEMDSAFIELPKGRDHAVMEFREALFNAEARIEAGAVVTIDAASLGHHPSDRGRRTGAGNKYWRDYCRTTGGHACYGPYHTLNPGVYVYYYNYRFQIPACGGANDTWVYEMDTTQKLGDRVGVRIPGSQVFGATWRTLCSRADENNIVDGSYGGRFAIANRTEKVEMRFKNVVTSLAGSQIEFLLRSLTYYKE